MRDAERTTAVPGPTRHLAAPALLLAALAGLATHAPWLRDRLRDSLGEGAAGGAAMAVGVAAWLAAAWFASRLLDVAMARRTGKGRTGKGRAGEGRVERRVPVPRLLTDLLHALIYGVALLAILGTVLDQPVTGLLATSGVVIAVLGFALRSIIADIFSGIALNIEHPYRIGDWVELSPGQTGRVDEINWRATRLLTLDGTTLVVPNGVAAGSRIVNYSRPGTGFRAALAVTLGEDVPVARAKRILLSALVCAGDVLNDPRPDVVVESLGPNGVVYQARFWVADYGRLARGRDAVAASILEQLSRAGIEPARPRRDLRAGRLEARRAVPGALRRSLMRQLDLFAAFTDAEVEALAKSVRRRVIAAGTTVVRQDERGRSLFLVAEGALDVVIAADGHNLMLDRLGPGDVFGEMSLLTGQPRSASVTANTDAVVYELDKDDLDPLLRQRPELADQLATLMVERQTHNSLQRQMDSVGAAAVPASDDLLARLRGFFHL